LAGFGAQKPQKGPGPQNQFPKKERPRKPGTAILTFEPGFGISGPRVEGNREKIGGPQRGSSSRVKGSPFGFGTPFRGLITKKTFWGSRGPEFHPFLVSSFFGAPQGPPELVFHFPVWHRKRETGKPLGKPGPAGKI